MGRIFHHSPDFDSGIGTGLLVEAGRPANIGRTSGACTASEDRGLPAVQDISDVGHVPLAGHLAFIHGNGLPLGPTH